MSVDQTCENIVRLVNMSKLDYQMNQTPYSMHFSIRKKFLRGHNPDLQISTEIYKDVEMFHIKQEYKKLYDLYQTSVSSETSLKSDILDLKTKTEALQSELNVAKEILDEK